MITKERLKEWNERVCAEDELYQVEVHTFKKSGEYLVEDTSDYCFWKGKSLDGAIENYKVALNHNNSKYYDIYISEATEYPDGDSFEVCYDIVEKYHSTNVEKEFDKIIEHIN